MKFLSKPILLATATALSLAACTTQGPNQNQKARQGAILGGLAGAAAGAVAGGNEVEKRNRIIGGAIVGAGLGAGIGNVLDRQEEDLRQSMTNGNVQITNTGDRLIVTLPNDILFAVDDATVRPDLQRDLRALAGNLQAYPNSTVQIVGHTDSDGDASYNLGLSKRRAESVANVLVAAGVSGGRLQTIGRGEDQPVADNLTPQGKAQNRRVEIVILPNA
ncbi:OmpA family protein [Marinovum sp.]|uniref:OmpA family protein n=1 Tax=Marinovum sp. TaxID=2024839 RepID=UPI002B26E90E|nr:OmpA family protein [Marinovum sp.]